MKFISNNNITDPTLNLAMEEYVLKHLPAEESYFLFYINRPSIIVGKNQNTIEEVNKEYIDKNNIAWKMMKLITNQIKALETFFILINLLDQRFCIAYDW